MPSPHSGSSHSSTPSSGSSSSGSSSGFSHSGSSSSDSSSGFFAFLGSSGSSDSHSLWDSDSSSDRSWGHTHRNAGSSFGSSERNFEGWHPGTAWGGSPWDTEEPRRQSRRDSDDSWDPWEDGGRHHGAGSRDFPEDRPSDEVIRGPEYEVRRSERGQNAKAAVIVVMILAILAVLGIRAISGTSSDAGGSGSGGSGSGNAAGNQASSPGDPLSNPNLLGAILYLEETEEGCYQITGGDWDMALYWDEEEEAYYDDETRLWLWYNTNVEPHLWQYWYEPISGDFGDYGWMEYEETGWYIEAERNRWIPVPDRYDTSILWHMAPSYRPDDDDSPMDLVPVVEHDSELDLVPVTDGGGQDPVPVTDEDSMQDLGLVTDDDSGQDLRPVTHDDSSLDLVP